ncbi:MAG: beta-ribofuranosylaminobenzene 5'-phosphate synthase [Methanothermobacter sp.]|mgnify:FL=1|uniref:beta-ribofuranosylaminobenzene 5'-phosphate synthase n=1 Tax=Methanothermobacter thermautotrophicus TaxID=145262 RepID=UPI001865AB78|nr:beta-ribofuranosylaminobenzene 5'-phosphate synthase [Methanothermobacter thermautotrophicus]MCQ8904899.1 beta-ribofuranosylaminobenzene 5'-phosphate synthase [Methanothermobacter sp.]
MIINTPSRLHLTLIDLNGERGRLDGGVGITLKEPELVMGLEASDEMGAEFTPDTDEKLREEYRSKIMEAARRTLQHIGSDENFHFTIRSMFPPHSGLGSGTQISLATARLIAEYHGAEFTARELAHIVGRGGTSGIGVASFEEGGFIVDAGHSTREKSDFLPSSASSASPPPVIARYDFPEEWNIIIAIPEIDRSVSGRREVNIFQEYCPIPLRDVERLSHIILMKMMPAVIEGDIEAFGESLNEIQGTGFKRIERELQDPLLDRIIDSMISAGAAGAGMSSFGPTVYSVTDEKPGNVAGAVAEVMGPGRILITGGRNRGAFMIK